MVAGQPSPSFSAEYSGFVLGQGPGVLRGALTFSTPRTPASPAGQYPIIPGGLATSNYAIAYVDGTLTVTTASTPMPPVRVIGLTWQPFKLPRRKPAKELVVSFSGPVNAGSPANLQAFVLDKARKIKHRGVVYSGRVKLLSPQYNAATNTVTLMLRGTPPTGKMQLTINAADVLDSEGREIDGNGDGQPGGDYVAILNKSGLISTPGPMAKPAE